MLITACTRVANDTHLNAHHVENQEYMNHSHDVLTKERPLPLSLENDVRCYRMLLSYFLEKSLC